MLKIQDFLLFTKLDLVNKKCLKLDFFAGYFEKSSKIFGSRHHL